MKRLLLVLILCAPAWAANDFTSDPNCKLLYRFESGALTADSKGTSTLTAVASPTADTTNYKEGAASTYMDDASSQYYSVADSGLGSGVPFKSDVNDFEFTITLWWRSESTNYGAGFDPIWAKGANVHLYTYNNFGTGRIVIQLAFEHGETPSVSHDGTGLYDFDTWYFTAVSYNRTTRAVRIYWANPDGSEHGTTAESVMSGAYLTLEGNSSAFEIGHSTPYSAVHEFDGRVDEFVMFDKALSQDDVNDIRDGLYPSSTTTSTSDWWWRRRHN